jgi:copper(I)-binding protein
MMKIHALKHIVRHTFILMAVAFAALAQANDTPASQKMQTNKNLVATENAWARPTQKGQDVGAAYMTLISKQNTSLIKAESNVTKNVEIHSMSMEKGVMKMRMLDSLPLQAGKPSKLEPGGFHLMLFDLKKPLIEGEKISIELTFRNNNGSTFKQQVKATVKTKDDGAHDHHHEHHH